MPAAKNMKSKLTKILFRPSIFSGIVFLLLLLFFLPVIDTAVTPNKVTQGVAHLSNVDGKNPVTLNGTWEYYENQFLFPSNFTASKELPKPQYVKVPGNAPNTIGYGTYRLRFDFISSSQLFALKISNLSSSARIYIDGELISNSGFASTLPKSAEPSKDTQYVIFPLNIMRKNHELIVQTANYTSYASGIKSPLYFGTQTNVYRIINQFRFSESIAIMSVSFLAILLILLLFLRIQIGNILYLLLFALCFSYYLVTSGNELLSAPVSSTAYLIMTRLTILTYSGMGIFMLMFLNPNEHVSKLISRSYRVLLWIVPVFLPVAVLCPPDYLPVYVITVLIHFGAAMLLSFGILIKRMSLNRQSAYLQFLALCLFISFFILNYANDSGYVSSTAYIRKYTLFIVLFVILQLANVALRFARIYSGNERLAQQMVVSDKMKDELMTVTSHELRTPLHGMINIIESAESKTPAAGELKHDLQLALTLARRMRSTINDLYGFHESSRDKVSLKPQNLRIEADALIEVFHYTKNNPNLVLFNHIAPNAALVLADESKLWQILTNLVGNAIKYTPKGHVILASSRHKDKIKITVTDSGIGMKSADIAHIFDKKVRLAEAYENTSGLGMGLYISKQLAEQMNGEMRVEWTRPGEGTCISCTLSSCMQEDYLRTQKQTPEQSGQVSHQDNFFDRLHPDHAAILAVDDNLDNLNIITHTFQDCDFTIDTAQHAKQALELLNKSSYDMVILDIMMPETNGFELCRSIRTKHTHFELPVLLLTARDSSEDILTGFWSGANDYITKPADQVELRARVFSLIALHQSVNAAMESELQFLHAQIQPHFLYNAFNTISAVALSDGIRASELIDDLGTYLRSCFSKNSVKNDRVPIANEMQMVEAYIRIEQTRFEERLQVTIEKQTTDAFYVPLLSVQPLVENAVRHGSMSSDMPLTVRVVIASDPAYYVIQVEDNGKGIDPETTAAILSGLRSHSQTAGIGLQNVNRRLKLYYDLPLLIEALPTRGTRVTIRIPKNL